MISSSRILISAAVVATAFALSNASPIQKRASAKRGVAWNYLETVNVGDVFSAGSSWTYSYEHFQPGGTASNGMEFVIMQRTADDTGDSAISKLQADAQPYNWVASFNEPDLDDGTNNGSELSPGDAAAKHQQYIQPLSQQGKKIVAPAVTSNTAAGKGLDWLDQFVAACSGCQFDAFAYHPYAPDANTINSLIDSAVSHISSKYPGKEIWITEFGRDGANSASPGGADMISQVIQKLESTPEVSRYAYIAKVAGPFQDQRDLVTSESSTDLTALGQIYNQ